MRLRIACIAVLSCAAACNTDTTSSSSYTVGGQVTGLTGSLTLANNTTDNLTVTGTGAFTFAKTLNANATYSVTVVTQPTGETCTVTDGTGTVANANVTSIKVACVSNSGTKYSVGGSLTGLAANAGTVVLTNGSDQVNVTASGAFVFPTTVASGTSYSVAATSAPSGWTCTVTNGSGTVTNSNITSVGVACSHSGGPSTSTYTLGGHVTGLATAGGTITIHNGSDSTSVSADGVFTVSTGLASGATYHVTVTGAPAGYACVVDSPNGTIGSANVTNLAVTCSQSTYTVSGTVSGQTGPFTLADTTQNTTVNVGTTDTTFQFTGYTYATDYTISVGTQPSGQACTVQHGNGLVCTDDVTNLVVTCVDAVSISGAVSGQSGDFLIAFNDNQSVLVSSTDTTYTIPSLPDGTYYKVSVIQHPAGKKCTIANATGKFAGNDVTGVDITCVAAHTLSGTLTGDTEGLLVKTNDGSAFERLALPTGSSFSLPITAGNQYQFYIQSSPVGQSCSITGSGANTGTMSANVTGLDITCVPATYSIYGTVNFQSPVTTVNVSDGTNSSDIGHTGYSFDLAPYDDQQAVTLTATPDAGACAFAQGAGSFSIDRASFAGVVINCQ